MEINMTTMLLIWLAVIIVTLVVEVITQGLTTIWFSIGAAVAAVTTVWNLNVWLQIIIFAAVSLIVMLLVRPMAKKMLMDRITPTNMDMLLKEQALVIENIDNDAGTGKVKVRDIEWTARTESGERIEAGEMVEIQRIDGVKLIVKR
ncbi:MAG TPA: NfeD family protein [Lachnospiraceae bacterium]|nr:NfeD family protein [Lachnospiraceae bacterium]